MVIDFLIILIYNTLKKGDNCEQYDFRKIDHIYMDNKENDDKANPLFPVLN